MRTKHLFPFVFGASVLLLVSSLFLPARHAGAQEEQPQEQIGGTLIVEQVSDMGVVGTWTILQPNHESFERTDATLTVPNLLPGGYSFFVTPPKGAATHIDVYLGDDIMYTSETPQISFPLVNKMTLRLIVQYRLTIFGKVGVNSQPAGIPFTLKGPDGMMKQGLTPMEYARVPIGHYSVSYAPKGCPAPAAQSDQLIKDGRADFMVILKCDTFVPVAGQKKETGVRTEDGELLKFNDVPEDAWFAPYITTIIKRGIMGGYNDARGNSTGKFGPGDPVTIAQLAKIAHTAIDLDETRVTTSPENRDAKGKWFTNYFASAEEQGWLVYQDVTVDPARPATRGEVMVTLLHILDIPVKWAKGNVFADVLKRTPYSAAIETAAQEGIVSGSTNADGSATGMFHPTDPITRAEIAKILINLHEKYQSDEGSSSSAR